MISSIAIELLNAVSRIEEQKMIKESDAAGEEWWKHATGDETTDSSIGEDAAIESATGDDGAAESERGVDGTVELHTPSSEEEASEDEAKLDMACLNYLAAVAFAVAVPAECLRRNACGC